MRDYKRKGVLAIFSEIRKQRDARLVRMRSGFTLAELLAVILIISILASIAVSGMRRAKELASRTECMSNLRQIGVAIITYRNENQGESPDWLSNLYPGYIDDLSVFVCRSDRGKGRGRTRPEGIYGDPTGSTQKYPETVDNVSRSGSGRSRPGGQNPDVEANSYFYEFSSARSPWNVPGITDHDPTWAEYKEWELREGNDGKPHSASRMPAVRCFHHAVLATVPSYQEGENGSPNKAGSVRQSGMTVNVSCAGNVFVAPLWWQGAVGIGDKR